MRALSQCKTCVCLEIQLLGIATLNTVRLKSSGLLSFCMIDLHGMLHGMIALCKQHIVQELSLQNVQMEHTGTRARTKLHPRAGQKQ